ncbi:3-phytase [Neptunitalea chrysea]|uniref:3-phytase n=1 Tax=Neptunitalea chrysea TaxID=1647581 RepID=A0A9W6EWB2_9FLAO|nr:esterase-like activity of phytase family protein [Neptunitalea chrysea]GLB54066.1 3-phytase [Neptunitalea chrysea]
MKKLGIFLILGIFLTSCATTNKIQNDSVNVRFLDEYVISDTLTQSNTLVGGLSGIDYNNKTYNLIVDTAKDARYYNVSISINHETIDTVIFNSTTFINKEADFFKTHPLDPESIRFIDNNEVIITSEGSINNKKDPSVFIIDSKGNYTNSLKLPSYFSATGKQRPRHNGVFEGLTKSFDNKGYWVTTELPLTNDGAKPKLFPTRSYVRVTYFDKETLEPSKQFTYKLDGISKIPWMYFAVNGVTEILEYKKDHFLVLERAYSAGHGSHSNTVKLFDVDASNTTNTLETKRLKKSKVITSKKKLIFDFKSIKNQLTDGIVDNIEGMCFGPVLPNGNQSLILVSDNNFNSFGKQLSQIILMEIKTQ